MTNMLAYRSTDPKVLRGVSDPIGKDNDKWIRRMVKEAGVVMAAWGDHGVLHRRAETVTRMVPNISCLRLNKTGQPAHPLYLPLGLTPVPLLG